MTTEPDAAPGLRERKKRATRRAIGEAALRLAIERGYDQVTVEEIAAAADVSPRTFFNYFATKDEAVVQDDPEAIAQVRRLVLTAPDRLGIVEVATAAVRDIALEVAANPDVWARRMQVVLENPALLSRQLVTHGAYEQALAGALRERAGLADGDDFGALVAAVLGAVLRVSITSWHADPSGPALLELFDTHARSVAAGLPTPTDRTQHRTQTGRRP